MVITTEIGHYKGHSGLELHRAYTADFWSIVYGSITQMHICITFVVLGSEPDYNPVIYSFNCCILGPQFKVISMLNCDVRAS